MKLIEMKQELANVGILPEQVKNEFGDLRCRTTWEAAHKKYCCYEDLPVVRAITEQAKANNIVAFVPPAPPSIVSPPASPTPPPEEENIPRVEPPMPPQEERTFPGDSRRTRLRVLPWEHLYIAIVSSGGKYAFAQQPIEYDESVITAAPPASSQLWMGNTTKVKRLPTYSLSSPFQIGSRYDRGMETRASIGSGGSRSPPK